jgi:molybdate transport repressor ModE-like protein
MPKSTQPYLAPDGKLSCQNACKMATEQELTLSQIGGVAQSENIRISDCLLGQFGSLSVGEFDDGVWARLQEIAVSEDRISCEDAMVLGEELGFDVVRSALLESGMDVVQCALGCFRERRKTKLYLKTKNWIENRDEELLFSKGKIDILELIDQHGSISKAAKAMGMSYKKAWTHIKLLQSHLEDEILITQKGAGKDSGTRLTPIAKEFIENYRTMHERITVYADEQFRQLFLTARSKK